MSEYPKEFLQLLNSIDKKRPRTMVQHILRHGHITSEEIKEIYGYNHPPRAIRDVRELGIPIDTYRVVDSAGRSIAAYRFGDPAKMDKSISKSTGRTILSKQLKSQLISKYGSKCFVYLEDVDESELQVDHRIPYEIGGDCDESDISRFMLLCRSANREKSWSCEHCSNWTEKDESYCTDCFWAFPENYTHIADRKEMRISLVYSGEELIDYANIVKKMGKNPEKAIKNILKEQLNK